MARDLLFEIGTEELPPTELRLIEKALGEEVARRLKEAELSFKDIETFATPRRLALLVHHLAEQQPNRLLERKGPPKALAVDEKGRPTKAALGFAKRCGVAVEALTTIQDEKGEWLFCRLEVPGKRTEELIPEILRASLKALPTKRWMRWGEGKVEFIRPVHWAVLLYGSRVISTEILGLETSRYTFGHRFHAPHALDISSPGHYDQVLFVQGKVITSFERRREKIREQLEDLARRLGGRPLLCEELLDEVTALVEWPVVMWGTFDKRFLELPPEVLITAMESHQRYFPLVERARTAATAAIADTRLESENRTLGQAEMLLPHFLFVANLESKNPETVRRGNERVIRPRLHDAEFFYRQDLKKPLEARLEALKGILFQQKLGTLYDKSLRLEVLCRFLADKIGADGDHARRAALLAKCDLTTEMVGEFPELQGIMGYYYAKAQGEPEEVARALEEQYRPRGARAPLPETKAGMALSIADKIDTLVGIFSLGEKPTGTKDPYGLRRAALGVIRMVLEKELDFDLMALLEEAAHLYQHPFDQRRTVSEVYDFIVDRLRGYLTERGYRHDEIEAVAAVRPRNLLDFECRLKAIHTFSQQPSSQGLSQANKRIRNILRKADTGGGREINPDLLQEPAERELYRAMLEVEEGLSSSIDRRAYEEALARLSQLASPLDRFFQEVFVMCEDEELRQNRLALLRCLQQDFLKVADISCLVRS